jgi:F-box protein 21
MHNLTGIDTDLAYRDLQNNYIGIALQDNDHPSLPLISVAIYCALAHRLGLDARCCGLPNHVHAMVFPAPSETLDGWSKDGTLGHDTGPMYLDPYRSDTEVPAAHLRATLASWGIQPLEFPHYLSDSNAANLILRTSRNILATVQEFRGQGGTAQNTGHPTIRLHANPFADMDNAFYSALWANFMLSNPMVRSEGTNQQQFIPLILERFERLYPMDATLIEQYICPVLNNQYVAERFELMEALRAVRSGDKFLKQVHARKALSSPDRVKYKVGQVFRHKRYTYTAVITGWDIECGMNPDWMEHNNVDALSKGRNQSFYHALLVIQPPKRALTYQQNI